MDRHYKNGLWFILRFLFAVLLLLPLTVKAESPFNVTVGLHQNVYFSDKLEAGPGISIKAGKGLYLWGSYEKTLLRFGGQESVDITLGGLGAGAKKDFEHVSLWIEGGWFQPMHVITRGEAYQEGAYIEMNQIVAPFRESWLNYEYDLNGGIGGAVGLTLHYDLSTSWRVGLSTSYRYLRLGEWIVGHNGTVGPEIYHWQIYQERDFSAFQVGLSVTYSF